MRYYIHKCEKKEWFGCKLGRFYTEFGEINQEMGDYFQVLDNDDRMYTLSEEINNRLYSMSTRLDAVFNKLKNRDEIYAGRKLTGIHTYDLLRNPMYIEQFQYFSAYLADRDDFIVDEDEKDENNNAQSDLVRIVLNIDYLPHDQKLENLDLMSSDGIEKMTGGKPNREAAQK